MHSRRLLTGSLEDIQIEIMFRDFYKFYALAITPNNFTMSHNQDQQRIHLYISGRVQGVFFRATTRDTAQELGITGWVKNLSDGRVEAVAEGCSSDLEEFVEFCHEGPRRARVDDVEIQEEDHTGEFSSFSIRYE